MSLQKTFKRRHPPMDCDVMVSEEVDITGDVVVESLVKLVSEVRPRIRFNKLRVGEEK